MHEDQQSRDNKDDKKNELVFIPLSSENDHLPHKKRELIKAFIALAAPSDVYQPLPIMRFI